MNTNGETEDGNKTKVDNSVNENRSSTGLHVPELDNLVLTSGWLQAEQPSNALLMLECGVVALSVVEVSSEPVFTQGRTYPMYFRSDILYARHIEFSHGFGVLLEKYCISMLSYVSEGYDPTMNHYFVSQVLSVVMMVYIFRLFKADDAKEVNGDMALPSFHSKRNVVFPDIPVMSCKDGETPRVEFCTPFST
ncbi:hypothetical protein PVK06_002870 [Gossypium arboreum]|uniref:Uncharacterized protein n=1 Tax=Gossypium arboreum TaxID=29729 RepID=A0ABR0R628_GOSAR|nr:hypothetical protein PVK06_002870 [Gossypium arboreum]